MKENLKIKKLAVEDVDEGYVNWFKEQRIIEYSDNQYRKITLEGQKSYVKFKNSQDNSQLFGIFDDLTSAVSLLIAVRIMKTSRLDKHQAIGIT